MLSAKCKKCKHVVWMIALGQGIRCKHPENQKYKSEDKKSELPVVISHVPENCEYFEK